jgi:hypothetical protein
MPEAPPPKTLAAPSLQALLAAIIDYAGLFPPARLPLGEALPRYARYRHSREAWMLSRFVCPAARLGDLAPFAGLFEQAPPFPFALLGTGGADAGTFVHALGDDLAARQAFLARHAGRVTADVLEVRLPPALLHAPSRALGDFLAEVAACTPDLTVFFEVPLDDEATRTVPSVVDALARYNAAAGRAPFGFKMRCGGPEPAAVPTPARVALALDACRRAALPFKATAGLHHPVRRHDPALGVPVFGFFNVFGAAVLAAAHDLDVKRLEAVLTDEAADHFRFTLEAFAWRDLTVPAPVVRTLRSSFARSFGSCSFVEPRDDLQALGLL